MAPDVNWGVIDSIAKGEAGSSNEENLDQAADMLREINEGDVREDPEKLILIFQTAKKILDYREQAMLDILQDQEDNMREKDAEIEDLRRNLEEEKKFGSQSIPRDAEFYRLENRRLAEEKETYVEQNEDLNRELSIAQEERRRLEQEADEGKKLVRELKAENQELRQSLRDYQNIVDKQQQQKISGQGQLDADTRNKLNERNQQISDLLTQITQLEAENRSLEEAAKKVKIEMETGQDDMEKMVEEYEKMRKLIGASDHFTDDLHRKNAQLNMQVKDLQEQLQ